MCCKTHCFLLSPTARWGQEKTNIVPGSCVSLQIPKAAAFGRFKGVWGEIEIPPNVFSLGIQNPVSFDGTKEMGF